MSQIETVHAEIASNPFALMMDPASVIAAVERSERLARLHSRVCRPLDKPQPAQPAKSAETAAFDNAVDDAAAAEE